jgi:hypothetical protein
MVEKEKTTIQISLEKLSTLSRKQKLFSLLTKKKGFKVAALVHLPSLNVVPKGLQKDLEAPKSHKPVQKIAVEALYEDENEGIHNTAFGTHLYSRKYDLHLLHYAKIFQENHLPTKKIVDWKLPKLVFLKTLISKLVTSQSYKARALHNFEKLTSLPEEKEQEDDKKIREQLSLQKEQSEKRNYLHSKPIF